MKVRLENPKVEYERKESALASDFNAYNRHLGAYNTEIGAGRERGSVKEAVYRQLTAEKNGLNNMHAKLRVCQEKVKMIADVLNNMTVIINDIAHQL